MKTEEDLLPISALQHLAYCERQCALIHMEQAWADNAHTVQGSLLHEKAHEPSTELRDGILIVRSLRLRSLGHGLSGVSDVVEFHPSESGAELKGRPGKWSPFPVEYKKGKPKKDSCDEVQLCAQALCLEEILGTAVARGALFYGTTRHRHDVEFTEDLRDETARLAARLHEMLGSGVTPPAEYSPAKCDKCSLIDLCSPKARQPSAAMWFRRELKSSLRDGPQARQDDP